MNATATEAAAATAAKTAPTAAKTAPTAEAIAQFRTVAGTVLPEHVASFLPEGVYFRLPERLYHNDPALGSGDMKRLAVSPPDFWFNSKWNPSWIEDDETPAQRMGSAAHKCVLEGRDAFHTLYAPTDFPGNRKDGMAERERIAEAGKTALKRDDFNRIELMGGMVRSNPTLAAAFANGAGPEVSIFWTSKSGLRKKCRIDYLKPRATVDLKTIANQFGEHFPSACRRQIASYRYDMQAAHYAEGRAQLARLVKAGAVFVGGKDQSPPQTLAACAAAREWAWVFVFVQKDGAPLTWGATISCALDDDDRLVSANPLIDYGRRSCELAEYNWGMYVKRFGGLGVPWVLEEPLAELSVDDFPAWSFK
jgi:hypothetical protein